MIAKLLAAVGLASLVAVGIVPPPAGAVVPAGKRIGGCALLGSANAARILGGPAVAVHDTNNQTSFGLVRGCIYSGAGIEVPYTVTTYPSVAIAKRILSTISQERHEPTTGLLLLGFDSPKIKGYPSVVDYMQILPGEGETQPAFYFLSHVIVRKGATMLAAEAATDEDSTPMLIKIANIIVPRM